MTTFTGTISEVLAGDTTGVAAKLKTHSDALKAAAEPLSTYTPTYSNITIGNGTVTARYSQIGKWVRGTVKIVMGSTTSFGSGALKVSLPVAPLTSGAPLGNGYIQDASPSALGVITAYESSGSAAFIYATGSAGFLTNTAPWTWATSDSINFSFAYEAA